MEDSSVNLPPGFRFSPTDEEIVLHFLHPKDSQETCLPDIIPDLHHCTLDPWQLDGKAFSTGNQCYFFSQMMDNKVTENGFWKELNEEESVFNQGGKKVGIKKFLVYYIGTPPEGIETNWMMQEYHLSSGGRDIATCHKRNKRLNCLEWVLCRVYQRKGYCCQSFSRSDDDDDDDSGTELSCLDEMYWSILDDELGADLEGISLTN